MYSPLVTILISKNSMCVKICFHWPKWTYNNEWALCCLPQYEADETGMFTLCEMHVPTHTVKLVSYLSSSNPPHPSHIFLYVVAQSCTPLLFSDLLSHPNSYPPGWVLPPQLPESHLLHNLSTQLLLGGKRLQHIFSSV